MGGSHRRHRARGRRRNGVQPDVGGSHAGKGRPSRLEGGTGGDDIVDDEDVRALQTRASPERHPFEAFPTGASRLGVVVATPLEQPPRRHPQLSSDVTGNELALIEATRPPARGTRRRPGDHVEATVVTVGNNRVDDQAGKMTCDLTSIPVLEAEHHVASATGEGNRRLHTMTSCTWPRAHEGESARDTYGNARGVASGTTGLEHHEISVTKGCGTVPRRTTFTMCLTQRER